MVVPLAEAIAAFDRTAAAGRRAEAEELRAAFLQEFPESDWPTLPLERYALGLGDDAETFSRWAEFRTRDLGSMSGGSARKHVIYKHKNKPGWHYPAQFANEQVAWRSLRADVVKMLALAREQRWEEMAELMPFQFGPALWLKTLHLYFPDDVLAVYSTDHLSHFWYQMTGESSRAAKKEPAILLNRKVLNRLRQEPGVAGLSPLELSYFLYYWNDPREARAVYKIAPGDRQHDARVGGRVPGCRRRWRPHGRPAARMGTVGRGHTCWRHDRSEVLRVRSELGTASSFYDQLFDWAEAGLES
jgi:5-methylcytosine-specific restriction protein B